MDSFSAKEFKRLADEEPDAHVQYCNGIQYSEQPGVPGEDVYWVRKIYSNLKETPQDQLVPNVAYGYTFQSYTTNVPEYLKYLVKTVKKLGGRLQRQSFESIQEVIEQYKDVDTVINCTGLGSYYLKDVQDHTMYPIRGQTITVRAPHIKVRPYPSSDRWTYIIPRGDGTVICGGTVDRVNRQTSPDDEITKSILERVYNLYPEITHGKGVDAFDIVAVNVGFRPGRAGGIRLEKEIKRFQSSWGASNKLVQLLNSKRVSKL
ncbi:hypothetical protein HPULCUR_011388 [Helicostylum pulchrum]|uniref:FAD dependent oxidoreductase domain-containing protein n=1 Tax=Helicostylum pulchrum TaxID=562976 RepID=A0ABP9YFX6_9FUNG